MKLPIQHRPKRPLIEELEPRLLFSADFAPALADALVSQTEQRLIGADGEFANTTTSQQQAEHARLEIVFIDLRVAGYQQILADIHEQNTDGHSIEVVLIDAERDGIAQIGEFLSQHHDIDAVHLIAHGSAGAIGLGAGQLNPDSLEKNAAAIQQWGNALSSEADILIYGCDLASNLAGRALIDTLSTLTGADVAASDDKTGSSLLGGDWVLEYQTGHIEASVALDATAQARFAGVLANAAPILDNTKTPTLTAENEDAGTPVGAVGTLVSSLVDFASPAGQLDNVTDPDTGALLGIAVTAADTTHGSWWYSTNGGTNWTALGSVSDTSARLLAADANTRIDFQPDANWNGTLANAITFRAWDQTSGSNGGMADLTAAAVYTASDNFDTHSSYNGSNGSAAWTGSWQEIGEADGAAAGNVEVPHAGAVVAGPYLQLHLDSAGTGLSRAIDLSGATSATLSFYYEQRDQNAGGTVLLQAYDGSTWNTVQTYTVNSDFYAGTVGVYQSFDISAYANANSAIRFLTTQAASGDSFYVDDVRIDFTHSGPGGPTAFSTAADTASLTVNAVNDLPVAGNDAYSVNEDTTLVVGPSTADLANWWGFDEGGATQTIASAGSLSNSATLGSTAGVDAADPTWTTGYVGGSALAFNGAGQYVDTTSTDLKTASSFTLSAWFQTNTTTGAHHILWAGYPGGNGYGNGGSTTSATSEMSLSIGGHTAAYDNKIVFSLGYDIPANGADSIFIASASNFTDTGSWHQVAVTVTDIGGGVMSASLYVDGKLEGTDTGSQNDRSVWGALRIGATGNGSRAFNGKIDEVRVYDSALSAGSIQAITKAGVLSNDTDVDNSLLKVNTSVVTGPANGTLSINSDGSFTYTPNANWSGIDSFTYQANDGIADSNVATVAITVNPVNDTPLVTSAGLTVSEGQTVTLSSANFGITDPDNASFTYTVSAVTGGIFQLSTATGTPIASFSSADLSGGLVQFVDDGNEAAPSFSVKVNDGSVDSNTLAATINYSPVNDAPLLAAIGNQTVNEGSTLSFSASASDADLPANTLSFSLANGTGSVPAGASISSAGVFSWTPTEAQGPGSYTFDVVVSDGSASDSETINITVNDINVAPLAVDDTISVAEDTPFSSTIDLDANDRDPDGDTLSVVAGTFVTAQGGSIMIAANGSYTYTPAANFNGTDTVDYTVTDGFLANTGTLTITLSAANDAPVVTANTLSIVEGTTIVLDNSNLNASDVEQGPAQLTYTLSNIAHGQFEWTATPGSAITSFTQADISAGQVVFVHDASDLAPAYDVTVSDGLDSQSPLAADITFTPVADPAQVDPQPTGTVPETEIVPVILTLDEAAAPAAPEEAIDPQADTLTLDGSDYTGGPTNTNELETSYKAGLKIVAPLFAQDIQNNLEIWTDPESQGGLLLRLLDIIQAEYTMGDSGQNLIASAMNVDITEDENFQVEVLTQGPRIAAVSLSVGAVWWALRAGGLFASLLTSLPAWRSFDVLPVLSRDKDEDDASGGLDDAQPEQDGNPVKRPQEQPA